MRWGKLAAAVLLMAAVGCAGAKPRLRFDDARYPVSNSHYVPAADGTAITYPRLERLGTFKAKGRGFTLFYTALPLNSVDLSDELNRQVETVGGQAVVGLKVESWGSGWNWFWPVMWIPIYPGQNAVSVEGAIVRDTRKRGPLNGDERGTVRRDKGPFSGISR